MDAPMNTRGVVGELRNTLDNAGRKFALALGFTGAKPEEINKTRRLGSSRILATLGALPKNVNQPKPAHAGVLGQSAENKGKTILDHLSSGLDRFLLSINICIVLLRAAGFDKTTVDPALAFVRELKVLYDALCSSVTPGDTNNAKVNSVKGALDALLAKPIPVGVMTALQAVVGPKRANDDEFNDYADEVKAAAAATIQQPNVANAARAAAEAAQKAVNNAAPAAAAPAGAQLPPPALAPLPAAPAGPPLPTDATPVDFGDTATGVKGNTAVFQGINIDAYGYVTGAPGVMINKPVKIYAVSYVPVGGLRMYELIGDGKIFSQASGKGIAVAFNKTPKALFVKFYTNPPLKTKGGRRRTKAKAKASRKTKRKATRRNRRS